MRFSLLITALILLIGCQSNKQKTKQISRHHSFYVGTYTSGESEGIYKYELKKDGGLEIIGLAAKSENPSFLTKGGDNKFLLATNETNNNGTGTIESFLISEDSLKLINSSPSGGAHPCYITVNNSGFVLVANYTGGNIGLLKLNSEGELSGLLDIQQHTGDGITERQEAPHAHSTWFYSEGRKVISVDLGTNELWFSGLDAEQQKLVPSEPNKLKMNPGAGPRHLAFHPNNKWIYVVNELDCTVTVLKKNNQGNFEISSSISTLPDGYEEPNTCADIHVSKDGNFVYASNRGHNSIVVYKVDSKNGRLKLIRHQFTHGEWPRNFSLSPDDKFLLVANQHSNNIVSFKRYSKTGLLDYVSEIKAPAPVCILF